MNTILALVICTIAIITNGWILYWKQYMTKKAENKAMDEDIENLTTKVEEVKRQFNENIEKVKAELSLFTSQKFSLSTEERNSIFRYFDAYHRWLHFATELNVNNCTDQAYTNRVEEYSKIVSEYDSAESKLEIFITDVDFLNLKNKINIHTIQAKGLSDEFFFKIQRADLSANHVKDQVRYEKATTDDYSKELEKKEKLNSEYLERQRVEHQAPLFTLLKEFRAMIKQKLIETISTEAS